MFNCLLWNKTKKKPSHLVIPSITQQSQPFPSEFASLRSRVFVLCRYFREQHEKNSLARPKKVYTHWVGLDGIWILSQITQNPFQLARNTNIVLRTTLSRLWLAMQAANYRGNYWQSYIKGSLSLEVSSFVLVEFRLEFIVNLPRRKTRFWFINHGSRRSSLSEGGLFSARYWLGLLFKQISSYSDQDKVKFVENVWKQLIRWWRWAVWLPRVSRMFEFYPSFCVELAEKISLAGIL